MNRRVTKKWHRAAEFRAVGVGFLRDHPDETITLETQIDADQALLRMAFAARVAKFDLSKTQDRSRINNRLNDYGISKRLVWSATHRTVSFRERPVPKTQKVATPPVGLTVAPARKTLASHEVIAVHAGKVFLNRLPTAGKVWAGWDKNSRDRQRAHPGPYETPLSLFWRLWSPCPAKKSQNSTGAA